MAEWDDPNPNPTTTYRESDKKDNPNYVMNPKTGRYVLRDGTVGRQILFGNTRCFLYNYHPLSGFLRVVVDNGVTEV